MREEVSFEEVVLRHRNLRAATTNARPADLVRDLIKYDKQIRRAGDRIWNQFKFALVRASYERDDLHSLCQVWATNWLGNCETWAKRPLSNTERPALLFTHVFQRGLELGKKLSAQARRRIDERLVRGEKDERDSAWDPRDPFDRYAASLPAEDEATSTRRGYLRTTPNDPRVSEKVAKKRERQRRKSCAQLLLTGLAQFSHDMARENLQEVAESPAACSDSRAAARRLLKRTESCDTTAPCPICRERDVAAKPTPTVSPQTDSLPLLREWLERLATLDGGLATRPGVKTDSGLRYLQYHRASATLLGFVLRKNDVWVPTAAGRRWLALPAGSKEEREYLKERVLWAPDMAPWRWFFRLPHTPGPGQPDEALLTRQLAGQRVGEEVCQHKRSFARASTSAPGRAALGSECERSEGFCIATSLPSPACAKYESLSLSTAERRARTIRAWRRYID